MSGEVHQPPADRLGRWAGTRRVAHDARIAGFFQDVGEPGPEGRVPGSGADRGTRVVHVHREPDISGAGFGGGTGHCEPERFQAGPVRCRYRIAMSHILIDSAQLPQPEKRLGIAEPAFVPGRPRTQSLLLCGGSRDQLRLPERIVQDPREVIQMRLREQVIGGDSREIAGREPPRRLAALPLELRKALSQRVIAGYRHAPHRGGDGLRLLRAEEAGAAQTPGPGACVAGPQRVHAVLDELDAPPPAQASHRAKL